MTARRIIVLTLILAVIAGIFGYRHARYQRGIKYLNEAISAAAGIDDPYPLRETNEDRHEPTEEEIRKTQELHTKWRQEMVEGLKQARAIFTPAQFEKETLRLVAQRQDAGGCMNIGETLADEKRFELALKTFDLCLVIIADPSTYFTVEEKMMRKMPHLVSLLFNATMTARQAGQMERARKYKKQLRKICTFDPKAGIGMDCIAFWPATSLEDWHKFSSVN